MAARSDTGGIFLSDNIWSKDKPENREDPQELIENNGWGESYAQAGGDPVQRKLMNRNFYKHGSLAYDINRYGILPWHKDITYEVGAVAIGSDNKTYRAEVQNTDKDPVINAGTEWKLAQFNTINGTQGNVTVTKDARNNLTINTAVNLDSKANKTLDNVSSGDLLGKFQDSSTIQWSTTGNKVKSDIPDASILTRHLIDKAVSTTKMDDAAVNTNKLAPRSVTPDKTNPDDKVKWADIGVFDKTPYTLVTRGVDGNIVAANITLNTPSSEATYPFAKVAMATEGGTVLVTSIANAKQLLGIKALEDQVAQLNRNNRVIAGFTNTSKTLNFSIQCGHTGQALIRVYANWNGPLNDTTYNTATLTLSRNGSTLRSMLSRISNSYNTSANPYFEYHFSEGSRDTTYEGFKLVIDTGVADNYSMGYSITPF